VPPLKSDLISFCVAIVVSSQVCRRSLFSSASQRVWQRMSLDKHAVMSHAS
jgi:hypothetical protein